MDSGREVARLTREHDAYRWICGGVSVNYHALNDFRAGNDTLMDELLTDNVAALAAVGAIRLERVAQDGMRVRADAGAASFRRQASLQEHLSRAGELVQAIKKQAQDDPGRAKRQAQAAKLRAAEAREERIRQALEQLPEVAATKKRNGGKPEDARASTTDAEARVMKMGDGGFRPAYNVQFATTCEEQVIVGMDVVNAGSDMAQLGPMVEQVERRLGRSPDAWLVDGGFPAHEQIDAVADKTEVYAPVPEPRAKKDEQGNEIAQGKHQPKADDSEAVAKWRSRMATDAAKALYKGRAATAECVNAQAQSRPAANAGAWPGQSPQRGGPVRAGAQPDAHGGAGAATHRLGESCVRLGRNGRLTGRNMTKPVQPRPARHVSTPITRISGTTFPFAAEVPSAIRRFRFRSGKRKTLSL